MYISMQFPMWLVMEMEIWKCILRELNEVRARPIPSCPEGPLLSNPFTIASRLTPLSFLPKQT